MIEIKIPGSGILKIKYFVMDYNGTLATDGKLIAGLKEILNKLAEYVEIHIITADTFGKAREELKGVNCNLEILPSENQMEAKRDYVKKLGREFCVAFGNGKNDSLMVKEAKFGISILGEEGTYKDTLMNSNLFFKSIVDALRFFIEKKRLIATLRS